MLSFRMAQVLRTTGLSGGTFRDLRTLRALQRRGLIKKVQWEQSADTYTFTLTFRGRNIKRTLRILPLDTLKELLQL